MWQVLLNVACVAANVFLARIESNVVAPLNWMSAGWCAAFGFLALVRWLESEAD